MCTPAGNALSSLKTSFPRVSLSAELIPEEEGESHEAALRGESEQGV